MASSRAFCISRDPSIRAQVEATLGATGLTVEHFDDLPATTDGAALLVIDRAARELAGTALTEVQIPVVVVGDDLDDDSLITLMIERRSRIWSAIPNLASCESPPKSSSRADFFGLEKFSRRRRNLRARGRQRCRQEDRDRRSLCLGRIDRRAPPDRPPHRLGRRRAPHERADRRAPRIPTDARARHLCPADRIARSCAGPPTATRSRSRSTTASARSASAT